MEKRRGSKRVQGESEGAYGEPSGTGERRKEDHDVQALLASGKHQNRRKRKEVWALPCVTVGKRRVGRKIGIAG